MSAKSVTADEIPATVLTSVMDAPTVLMFDEFGSLRHSIDVGDTCADRVYVRNRLSDCVYFGYRLK